MRKPANQRPPRAGRLIDNSSHSEAVFPIEEDRSRLVVPLGSYRTAGGLQVLDAGSAASMARDLHARGRVIPVCIGCPALDKGEDQGAYGWAHIEQATRDAIIFRVKWNPPGRKMVEQRMFRYFAPAWWVEKGSGGFHPTSWHSLGLAMKPDEPSGAANADPARSSSSGNRKAERAAAIASELARIDPGMREPERKRLAWRRAAFKNPQIFR